MNRSLLSILSVLLMLVSLPAGLAQDSGWPRTLPLEKGMVTIYQLQVDEMNDDIIRFRAALAYRETADAEPVFGAGWFESRVEIDQASRIVHPRDLKVTETRFPVGTDDVQSELSAVLAQESPAWNLDFSLDELQASLKTAQAESQAAENLNTAPPRILYRDHPALLISMDGEPVLRDIENSSLKAVINTPYPLISNGRHYYLNVAKGVWYRADQATGPYRFESNPPAEIAAMVDANEATAAVDPPLEPITAANAPEIVVSTEPAEMIVTEGPAAFVPLVDDLLVLQNSDDDVFMHVSSQNFYIVLAGRWYQANSLNGPWTYQPADNLPPAFANIPQDSDQADSRVYVAGTQEARDAVLDAQVPQTAAVERGEVDIEVEYDGEPVLRPVDGSDLVYIENTGSTVLQSDGLYYLVEDGVWYVSTTPDGPWQVSDHRPPQVDTILPTSPVYNVKYVHVYDSTPNVVYVGYTPGYLGSYVYHNTIFYGSGWYYQPWVSPYYYYPRQSTWGFNVGYNPWSGWNFGLSWGWGPFSFSYYSGGYWHNQHYWHHRHYGRWGPGRYRPRPVHHGRHGYDRYGYNRHGYDRHGYDRHGYDRYASRNIYRDDRQRAPIADSRDNRPRNPGARGRDTWQEKYATTRDRREQKYTGNIKSARGKPGPVKPADLRVKAEVRDTNFKAGRSRLFADSSGKVYRKPGRSTENYDAIRRRSPADKSTKNKTKPAPPRNETSIGKNVSKASGRSASKSNAKRPTRSKTIAAPPPSKTQAVENRRTPKQAVNKRTVNKSTVNKSTVEKRTSQRSSPAVNAPDHQPQKTQPAQRAPYKSTPAQRTQYKSAPAQRVQYKSAPAQRTQYKSAPAQRAQYKSAPAQRAQYKSAPAQRAQYKSAPAQRAQYKSAPVQRAPQKSTHKASSQRQGPKMGRDRVEHNRPRRK